MRAALTNTDKTILGLAIPALGSLAIDPLLSLADTAFVARLGTVELAALGVDTAILTFGFFLFNFLAYVLTPLVAKALGKGNPHEARRWVGDALLIAVVLGLVVTVLLVVLAPVFIELMGATAEVAGPAVTYLRIRSLSTTAVLIVTVGHGAFRGHKDTVTPLKVVLVVNAVNLVLDPILIFGLGWGLAGAAVATVLAQAVGAAWFLRLIIGRRMASRSERFTESLPFLFALAKNGILFTTRAGFVFLAFAVGASAATRIGTEEIAAHQLVAQLFLLSALLADAFAVAAQPMVAETAAEGDSDAVNTLVGRLLGWGLLAGLGVAGRAGADTVRRRGPLRVPASLERPHSGGTGDRGRCRGRIDGAGGRGGLRPRWRLPGVSCNGYDGGLRRSRGVGRHRTHIVDGIGAVTHRYLVGDCRDDGCQRSGFCGGLSAICGNGPEVLTTHLGQKKCDSCCDQNTDAEGQHGVGETERVDGVDTDDQAKCRASKSDVRRGRIGA